MRTAWVSSTFPRIVTNIGVKHLTFAWPLRNTHKNTIQENDRSEEFKCDFLWRVLHCWNFQCSLSYRNLYNLVNGFLPHTMNLQLCFLLLFEYLGPHNEFFKFKSLISVFGLVVNSHFTSASKRFAWGLWQRVMIL